MKPVFQTIIERGNGNCFPACVASILELPLEQVPNFYDFKVGGVTQFWKGLKNFLSPHGYIYIAVDHNAFYGKAEIPLYMMEDCHVILTVPSQAFPGANHVIVGKYEANGFLTIMHDPNPNNQPYSTDDVTAIGFLVKTI